MLYTIEEIKEKVKPVAEKYGIQKVFLFGSYARGTATEKSDVDILVDVEGSEIEQHMEDFYDVLDEFEEALQKEVDILTVQSIDIKKRNNRQMLFVKEIEKDRRLLLSA